MQPTILWVDDEIDLLRPHIIFLEQKGYRMLTASNGHDAIELVKNNHVDLVFLDENMPGLGGLDTLPRVKDVKPTLPVVMVTKSEEENIMDMAVGAQISDYLIKPVNPMQVLLVVKKFIHGKELVIGKQLTDYRNEFQLISELISSANSYPHWIEIYRKLSAWQVKLANNPDANLKQMLEMQMDEANRVFGKFIRANYLSWFRSDSDKPLLSPAVLKNKVLPLLASGQKVLLVVVDNFRFDQWKMVEPMVAENWQVEAEDVYFSILPTATQYARNALFSGLMPLAIHQSYPDLWVFDEEDEGKNLFEKLLLQAQLQRNGIDFSFSFVKTDTLKGLQGGFNLKELLANPLAVLVYNFVDVMSHSRTDSEMMRGLAADESAYLSLTRSWFLHSDLRELLTQAATSGVKVVLTTDHGAIRVKNPVKVVGDKATSTNLRYKLGRSLNYNPKEVFDIRKPEEAHLPKPNISSSFIFALGNDFLAYPNNFNYYASYYRNTFQHGGISLEEMIVPIITLNPIKR